VPDRRHCACTARCRFQGSLARSTQRDPINDVDVIVVFERSAHADWGEDGVAALPKGADVEVDAIVAL
jgi:predicted nucleotidyltransferase